jgi:non-ribosomal peptide synthetase component F
MVPHAALANFLMAMRRALRPGPRDALLAVTTPCFDIAALELLLPLAAGARVAVAARHARTLLAPTSVRIKPGRTGRVRLTLSAYGRAQLRRKGHLAIRVRIAVRSGGKPLSTATKRVTFRGGRHR